MRNTSGRRRNKHLVLDQTKLKKAQEILGAKTEAEAVERALESVITENERDRRAWAARKRFIKATARGGLEIKDVFGRLDGG